MNNSNTNNTNTVLTAAQKRALTIANKKALQAISEASKNESKELIVVKKEEALQVLSIDTYNALITRSSEFEQLTIEQLKDIDDELSASNSLIIDVQKNVCFRASEVENELQAILIAVSDSKKDAMQKNYINRLKANKAFTSASVKSLELIVKHSDSSTLDYLLNASNYKTASRILDASKMLSNEKHSSILDYTLSALNRSMLQKTSVSELCIKSSQCYSRISNAIKALAFFDLITVDNVTIQRNIITKMSKDTLISLANK